VPDHLPHPVLRTRAIHEIVARYPTHSNIRKAPQMSRKAVSQRQPHKTKNGGSWLGVVCEPQCVEWCQRLSASPPAHKPAALCLSAVSGRRCQSLEWFRLDYHGRKVRSQAAPNPEAEMRATTETLDPRYLLLRQDSPLRASIRVPGSACPIVETPDDRVPALAAPSSDR
jgi:hypothetical protein